MGITSVIQKWRLSRFISLLKYGSCIKVINLLLALFSWLINKKQVISKPVLLRVEISRKCHIGCLYCFSAKSDLFYPLDLYKLLVDRLKKYLFVVLLYDIGEPLENEKIIEFIKFTKSHRIGTIVSSHLSLEKENKYWEELVQSGLDRLIVSIDGTSAKIYSKYRVNGELDLALRNLEKILYYKRLYRSKIRIEWQIIDFEWNKSDQVNAKELARRMGCDDFRVIQNTSAIRRTYKYSNYLRKRNCIFPYITFNVTTFNKARSCAVLYNEDMTVGDLNYEGFDAIWNGSEIARIRSNKLIQKRSGCMNCQN